MTIILDQSPMEAHLPANATIGDALAEIQNKIGNGRIVVKVAVDGQSLEGSSLTLSRLELLGDRTLTVGTDDLKELSFRMIGRLGAHIEWVAPQHKEVASLLEKGDTAKALERLAGILSCWNDVQQGYGSLAKLHNISLKELPVHQLNGEAVMDEFCRQLGELQTALQNQDFVLLADILQYEMDAAVSNWNSVLESTLAVVDPSLLVA